jgi:hypothetical protein
VLMLHEGLIELFFKAHQVFKINKWSIAVKHFKII